MASMASAVTTQAIEKLQAEKAGAAKREDYAAAAKIKEQINELQRLAERLQELEAQKRAAAAREDYAAAANYKKDMDGVVAESIALAKPILSGGAAAAPAPAGPSVEARIAELEQKKKEAVSKDDYAAAGRIKAEIDTLKSGGGATVPPMAAPAPVYLEPAPEPPAMVARAVATATAHPVASAHSASCEKGCGRASFGKFATCCTHCRGAAGPHAADCDAKFSARLEQQARAIPTAQAVCVPIAQARAVPVQQPVYAQPAVAAVAQPVYGQPAFAQPVYAQPVMAPAYAVQPVMPVYAEPRHGVMDMMPGHHHQRHHGHHGHHGGMGMAVGAGVGGLAAGAVGGMMLERELERERFGGGYGGVGMGGMGMGGMGMGMGGTGFIENRSGMFGTDIIEGRRDMFGGTDVIESRSGMFGSDVTEVRTDMFGDRQITEVRTDMFGDREVIRENVDMFGDVSIQREYDSGFGGGFGDGGGFGF